ncbi:hypothetical protein F4781DRAFT_422344 [Annulohypoxylon bovei var. microspora]|nr:hypothetical protein F4781DRAFT_422344 [Annulohypoxylon bovei var. microspora]
MSHVPPLFGGGQGEPKGGRAQTALKAIKYPVRKYHKFQDHRNRRSQDGPLSWDLGLWSRLHPSLQQGYKYCFAVVASVWILCFAFTIWVSVSYKASEGLVYTPQTGNCTAVRETNFWIHLLINILASALYTISSYIMQRLAAPTREDINKAHHAREGLRIGSLAIRNLALLGRKRRLVFALLWASSFPIHLVFNSLVVYSSTNAGWPSAVFMLSTFRLDSLTSDNSSLANLGERQHDWIPGSTYNEMVQYILHQQPPLTYLTPNNCIETFGSGLSERWGDVVLVYKTEGWYQNQDDQRNTTQLKYPYNSSDIGDYSDSYVPNASYDPWSWMCGEFDSPCDVQTILKNDVWSIDKNRVIRCLARELPELCELNVSLAIMIIMLICISCKLVCIILAASLGRNQSLLTVGDAVASFLEDPDRVPLDTCWLPYTSRRKRVMVEAKGSFWTSTIFGLVSLSIVWWFFAFTFRQTRTAYENSKTRFDFNTMLRYGLGQMPAMWTGEFKKKLLTYGDAENPSTTYTSGASLANLPQIALSAFYLVFNNYITRLFVALEFRSFSTRRRGLRVSEPSKGTKQRRAHFLQIPLRYSLLNMAIFTLLHTFLSQALFLRRVNAIYPQSFDDPNDIGKKLIPMIGYSPVSCFALAILLTTLVVSGIVIGLIPIDWRFPDTSGSSLVIGAACHPPKGTQNSQEGEVRWGVTNKNSNGAVKCSFSLLPVRPPEVGEDMRR